MPMHVPVYLQCGAPECPSSQMIRVELARDTDEECNPQPTFRVAESYKWQLPEGWTWGWFDIRCPQHKER